MPSFRELRFTLTAGPTARAILTGRFVVRPVLRYPVLGWFSLMLLVWGWSVLQQVAHGAPLKQIAESLGFIVLGTAMAFGYLAWAVFLGRSRDKELVRVLRILLAGEPGATYMKALLAPGNEGFLDTPPEPS